MAPGLSYESSRRNDIAAGSGRHWVGAARLACAGRFSRSRHPHHRASVAGRRRRHFCSPDCRQDRNTTSRSVRHREPHWRKRYDRRPRCPSRRAGRLHAAVPRLDAQHRPTGDARCALRSGDRFHAHRIGRPGAYYLHHRQQAAGEDRCGYRRRRQGQTRRLVFCNGATRRARSSRRGRVQPVHGPECSNRRISRHRASRQRRGRRVMCR